MDRNVPHRRSSVVSTMYATRRLSEYMSVGTQRILPGAHRRFAHRRVFASTPSISSNSTRKPQFSIC